MKRRGGLRQELMVRTIQFSHLFSISAAGSEKKKKNLGVYSNETPHGAQMNIKVQNKTKLYITLSKKDLRFSCGADVDNRHGLYMLQRNNNTTSHLDRFVFVAATGTFNNTLVDVHGR